MDDYKKYNTVFELIATCVPVIWKYTYADTTDTTLTVSIYLLKN